MYSLVFSLQCTVYSAQFTVYSEKEVKIKEKWDLKLKEMKNKEKRKDWR